MYEKDNTRKARHYLSNA